MEGGEDREEERKGGRRGREKGGAKGMQREKKTRDREKGGEESTSDRLHVETHAHWVKKQSPRVIISGGLSNCQGLPPLQPPTYTLPCSLPSFFHYASTLM